MFDFTFNVTADFAEITYRLETIMTTQAELAQTLTDLAAQADKSRAEVLAKISDLETAIAEAGNTTPEVDAALATLKTAVQAEDDIVPDAPAA